MATITSTASDFNLTSTFTCTTTVQALYVSIGAAYTVGYVDKSMSTPTAPSKSLTFTYSSLGGEQVNTAVLTITAGNNPAYGGYIIVNGEQVYARNGVFTYYLDDLSIIGDTSTTLTVQYKTYGATHDHRSDYDSKTTSQSSSGLASEVVYTTKYKKNHSSAFSATNVQLRILTGSDAESANKASHIYVGVNDVAKLIKQMYVGVNGKAKRVANAWVGVNGVARKIWPCVILKDLPAGSVVQIDETGDGTLVDYIVVAQNHYLNSTNTKEHTVFMRKNLLNATTKYGDNTYGESYIGESLDTYVNNSWRASLSDKLFPILMKITIPCNKWTSPYTSSAERQIWVPSKDEIDPSYIKNEGPCFEYFTTRTTNADRIARTTDGTARNWWTRSCVEGMGQDGAYVRIITSSGSGSNYTQTQSHYCRPVFCLPSDLPVSPISSTTYDLVL